MRYFDIQFVGIIGASAAIMLLAIYGAAHAVATLFH
jgi:hypothetical protein